MKGLLGRLLIFDTIDAWLWMIAKFQVLTMTPSIRIRVIFVEEVKLMDVFGVAALDLILRYKINIKETILVKADFRKGSIF